MWGGLPHCEIKSSLACTRVVLAKMSECGAICVERKYTDIVNRIVDPLHILLVNADTQVLKQTNKRVV
jgi:hypothetical protein